MTKEERDLFNNFALNLSENVKKMEAVCKSLDRILRQIELQNTVHIKDLAYRYGIETDTMMDEIIDANNSFEKKLKANSIKHFKAKAAIKKGEKKSDGEE